MITLKQVFLILALVCFLVAALGVQWPRAVFIAAGLFFLTFSMLVT